MKLTRPLGGAPPRRKVGVGRLLAFAAGIALVASIALAGEARAVVYLGGWDLVDSGKHLDVDISSAYRANVLAGMNAWNAYKPGVIRLDSWTNIQDVAVRDVNLNTNWSGMTYKWGQISLNTFYLGGWGQQTRTNVATHELGHALGLGHSTVSTTDVMFGTAIVGGRVVPLSANDKSSYDAAYKRY